VFRGVVTVFAAAGQLVVYFLVGIAATFAYGLSGFGNELDAIIIGTSPLVTASLNTDVHPDC